MITRKEPTDKRGPKKSNPILHVAYQPGDSTGIEMSGGGRKEFVDVTPDLRRELRRGVANALESVTTEQGADPDIPSVLVMRLRSEAIAKSHRPVGLAMAAGMAPAGHGQIDEMLVTATVSSLHQLDEVVATRNTQELRANLSTLSGFEAWDVQKRLPHSMRSASLRETYDALKAMEQRLLFRLFRHSSEETMQLMVNRWKNKLLEAQLTFVELPQHNGPPKFVIEMDRALSPHVFKTLLTFQGVRSVKPEPTVRPSTEVTASSGFNNDGPQFTSVAPDADMPLVGVFDTGVDPQGKHIGPWVVSRAIYVLPPETDYVHGTAVSSLVVDGSGMNGGASILQSGPCLIHDVCALESNGSRAGDLIIRLREALSERPDIKVWNLSLAGAEVTDDEFSEFGRELDALADKFEVLFVVAAGNYLGLPRREWPVTQESLSDRVASPSDAVRALTVGAVTHLDDDNSLVKAGEPAAYSRRGPGPVFTPKPDLVHVGGNSDHNLDAGVVGLNVMVPGNSFANLCGTSFAAPLVASLAARTWDQLNNAVRELPLIVTPNMIKALLIHSAQLNSPERDADSRRYFGAGLPRDATSILTDSDSSFTMLFELDMFDGTKWRKAPFPIPASLIHDGKLRAEVIITTVYSPPLDAAAGAEYVRANVDIGFGTLDEDAEGKVQFTGQVPAEFDLGTTGFERAQIQYGGKWSPVKIYRRRFPRGRKGTNWALQATMVRRAFEPQLSEPLRVHVLVTLRALDGNPNVYTDGQRAMAEANWITQRLATEISIST